MVKKQCFFEEDLYRVGFALNSLQRKWSYYRECSVKSSTVSRAVSREGAGKRPEPDMKGYDHQLGVAARAEAGGSHIPASWSAVHLAVVLHPVCSLPLRTTVTLYTGQLLPTVTHTSPSHVVPP